MKKALIFILVFLLIANIALASTSIQITPKKSAFAEGDTVAFDYTITSGISQRIIFMPHITCPAIPVAIIEEKRGALQAGVPLRGTYGGAEVSEDIDSQECTASIEIISPEVSKKETKLQIKTKHSFDFNLLSCADSSCSKQKRDFIKGSTVYLKGNSAATASVTFPDNTKKIVPLPGSFAATQAGEYTIDMSATKAGFKPFASRASIFVVEQAFTVPYADFSSKAGQAVVRPVFKAPSAITTQKVAPTSAIATKSSFRNLLSRVTGYFAAVF